MISEIARPTGTLFLKSVQRLGPWVLKGICLAKLKQQNHKGREDRKDTLLRGLCGLGGSNSDSRALFSIRFADG
jgi:hypothetical protein